MKPIHYILIIAAIILGWFCYRKFKKEAKNKDGSIGQPKIGNDLLSQATALEMAAKAGVDHVELFQNSDDECNAPSRYSVKINGTTYYVSRDTFRALKKQDNYQVWD